VPLPGPARAALEADVGPLRDRTWGIAEEWAALGWPWMERLLKGAIALSKGEK